MTLLFWPCYILLQLYMSYPTTCVSVSNSLTQVYCFNQASYFFNIRLLLIIFSLLLHRVSATSLDLILIR
uniref:G-protein coupled receptors family 1 profile domain-containing protein n=1 Tax=Ciona savignyi TaxID=51511 RepID=H2ZNQ8_CIOSA